MKISAIILAAGQSRRMGAANKLILPWKGGTLVERMVRTTLASRVTETIVVLGHQAETVGTVLARFKVGLVVNRSHTEGLTSSIQTGIRAVSPDSAGFLIIPADMPALRADHIDSIIGEFQSTEAKDPLAIVVPVHQGQRGNPVLFSSGYRSDILSHPHPEGCRDIVQAHSHHVRSVEMSDCGILQDIDTADEYRAALG